MGEDKKVRSSTSEISIAVDPATVNTTYELFIIIIAILSLIAISILVFASLPAQMDVIFYRTNFFLSLFFLFDFFRSLIQAKDKLRYLRWGWLELLGGIPFFPILGFARIARIARGVRRVRRVRASEIRHQFTDQQAQSALLSTALVALIVVIVGSVLVVNVESQAPDGNIVSGEDALWWALVTISTVGYGDLYPVTDRGRLIAGIVIIVGVALYSVIVSFLASKFVTQSPQDGEQLSEIKAELGELRKLVEEFQQLDDMDD
jgi:voltage-gated potassium channel